MDRSTYDKMKFHNFHLLIGILLVFMLYQSADDNLKADFLSWLISFADNFYNRNLALKPWLRVSFD